MRQSELFHLFLRNSIYLYQSCNSNTEPRTEALVRYVNKHIMVKVIVIFKLILLPLKSSQYVSFLKLTFTFVGLVESGLIY